MSRRRWVIYLLSLVPAGALLALLAWGSANSGGNPGGTLVNSRPGEEAIDSRSAPSFVLESLSGGPPVDSGALLGKIVMIDFWSSWCPPCRAEASDLAQVYREYEGAPVEFVGVAIWDVPEDARDHLERFNVTYLNVLDARGKVAVDYGVKGIPEKFFLDRQGTIVKKYLGPMAPDTLRKILDDLLAS